MLPLRAPDATALLSAECVAALDRLSSVEVLAGVHVLNRASHVAALLDTVDASLGKHVPPRRAAVLVADGGSQDGTADVVRAWCGAEPRGPTRCLIELGTADSAGPRSARAPGGGAPPRRARRRRARRRVGRHPPGLDRHPDRARAGRRRRLRGARLLASRVGGHAHDEPARAADARALRQADPAGHGWVRGAGGPVHRAPSCRNGSTPGHRTLTGTEVALTVGALTSGARVVEVHLGRRPIDPGSAAARSRDHPRADGGAGVRSHGALPRRAGSRPAAARSCRGSARLPSCCQIRRVPP